MAIEIERKFLVRSDGWRTHQPGLRYLQGYLYADAQRTIRVRVAGEQGYLTVKGPSRGAARAEYEYPIPLPDAQEMLEQLCRRPLLEKMRTRVPYAGLIWEVDEFLGANAGLILAEVELTRLDQVIELPDWVGVEVTRDRRYYNARLASLPYNRWRHRSTTVG